MKQIRIGIDQSLTSSGIVATDLTGDLVGYFLVKTTPRSHPCIHDRIEHIAETVSDGILMWHMSDEFEIMSVTIEGLSYGSVGRATRDLAGVYFLIVNRVRARLGMNIAVCTPTQLKKHACGNGAAKKPEVYAHLPESVQATFKEEGKSRFDVSDAYFLSTF